MNVIVGYVQSSGDIARETGDVKALMAMGCQTVRIEGAAAPDRVFKPVLDAVCDFLGPGDHLLVPDVTHLGTSPSSAQAFLNRLTSRGARLRLLDSEALEEGLQRTAQAPMSASEKLRAQAVGGRGVDVGTVRALSAHGFGPSQIARKLGVSRMTVWRKLAATAV